VYSITMRTIISGNGPTDAVVKDAIAKLTHPAGKLTYTGRGFGDFTVDNGGVLKDVMWGPIPQVVSLRPMGGKRACELTWSVEFALPTCRAVRIDGKVMEYNYRLTFDVDRLGITKRTYSGYLKIPGYRSGPDDLRIRDSADSWRERIVPAPIPGFRRIPGTFELDEAKTTLRFTITDEEMGANIPPPGVIQARASHSYASSTKVGMQSFSGTISADYTLSRSTDVIVAQNAFWALCRARQAEILRGRDLRTIIPLTFSSSEPDLYAAALAVSFSLTYSISAPLEVILQAGGLGRPIPGSNWRRWLMSMGDTLGPRGNAGVIFNPGHDKIIDLCHDQRSTSTLQAGAGPQFQTLRTLPVSPFPSPTPNTSWLDYRNRLRIEADSGVSTLKTLPTSIRELRGDPASKGAFPFKGHSSKPTPSGVVRTLATFGASTAGVMLGSAITGSKSTSSTSELLKGGGRLESGIPETANTHAQKRVSDTIYLLMEGRALRAGYEIPVPQIVEIGGIKPIPCNRLDRGEGFAQEIIGNVGVPLYAAQWRIRLLLPELPKSIPTPPNPLYGS
jgi:hypothetical protein